MTGSIIERELTKFKIFRVGFTIATVGLVVFGCLGPSLGKSMWG